jgi:hypothetical protein
MSHLSEVAVAVLLRRHVEYCYGSQAEAARIWGVSAAFVNAVLTGHKLPNGTMLDAIGVERVTIYRTKETT